MDAVQTCLTLGVPRTEAERVFALLETEFEDDGFAIAAAETAGSDQTSDITIYCPADDTIIAGVIERMRQCLGGDLFAAGPRRDDLPDIDWVTKSLEGLKPVRAGRFLVHGSHDRAQVRKSDISIEIEAGRAFGTGHHGTTSGCLDMIQHLTAGRRVRRALDLGTGSAVLAIAIAKLHKAPVLATDIDPVATAVARSNIRLNGVHGFVDGQTAAGLNGPVFDRAGPFDLIVANILPGPLMSMAPHIRRHLAGQGGDLVLSGILATQRYRVLSAFRQAGLVHCKTITRGEWVTLHLRRKCLPGRRLAP